MACFLRVDFKKFVILGCYISPNITFVEYRTKVDQIVENIEQTKVVLIVGDINAISPMWLAPITDKRGLYCEKWIKAKDKT